MGKITLPKWRDETQGRSSIEKLHFPSDRKWIECEITIKGESQTDTLFYHQPNQHFTVYLNEKKVFDGELFGEKLIKEKINAIQHVSVTGEMSKRGLNCAMGSVTVSCTFEDSSVIKSKEATPWQDETAAESWIEGVYLDSEQEWIRCEAKIEGLKNKVTFCTVTLLAGGEILKGNKLPEQVNLYGTDSKVFTFEIGKKVPLLLVGYIKSIPPKNVNDNEGDKESTGSIPEGSGGAGAKITLTGFYK